MTATQPAKKTASQAAKPVRNVGPYNATVYDLRPTGARFGVFVAQVNEDGLILRSNWLQSTGFEGFPIYDEYLRRQLRPEHTLRIEMDGCAGYRRALGGE